jgi:hypothetical protein
MLGRHVYRVSPLETGGWIVRKEGEVHGRGSRDSREEAEEFACALAAEDQPSKVIVESAGGAIAEERVFGADAASAADNGALPEGPASGGRE